MSKVEKVIKILQTQASELASSRDAEAIKTRKITKLKKDYDWSIEAEPGTLYGYFCHPGYTIIDNKSGAYHWLPNSAFNELLEEIKLC